MKKAFLVFMGLMFTMCLVGCGEEKEKINIDFIIDGKSHLVEIDKGTSISKDIIPLINKEEIIELYYDENMENEYNDEKIENDTKIYVKNENSIEDISLNEEIEVDIKKSYILNYCDNDIGLNDIKIEEYYGLYNDYYAILIKELNKGDSGALRDVIIAGITFKYPFSNREILLWKEGKFVSLVEAYEDGLIQMDDLIKIHKMFNS